MAPTVKTLYVKGYSDGDSSKGPSSGYVRNDEYWLVHLANDKWAKDLGHPISKDLIYRLDKLPSGFSGHERTRDGTRHVDRYIYGHRNGVFRSIPDFYPHFKYLMDEGGLGPCQCKLCGKRNSIAGPSSDTNTNPESARNRSAPSTRTRTKISATAKQSVHKGNNGKQKKRAASQPEMPAIPPAKRPVDQEHIPDIYRILINELEQAAPERLDTPIIESSSPDWVAGNEGLRALLAEWRLLPGYVPRPGDVVLFTRDFAGDKSIQWDYSSKTFRTVLDDGDNKTWQDLPTWEAGVVTQMPVQELTIEDLLAVPQNQTQGINASGFRIQPLARPNSVQKKEEKQYKYVPLHAIRPFSLWKDCVGNLSESDRHLTIQHALTMASSFTLVDRFRFKGTWPSAAVFARGIYIGAELILVGDIVRLDEKPRDKHTEAVTDILKLTAIKMHFVDLDEASRDDLDDGHPYGVCLHVSGFRYTQDPTKSFDGVGKQPITVDDGLLPPGILEIGTWYHCADPNAPSNKTELPYQRILGRCYENAAIDAWYSLPEGLRPRASFVSVNTSSPSKSVPFESTTRGFDGILEARDFSRLHDSRIDEGKKWFFAETRIEQLDLHEVNGTKVGIMDKTRKPKYLETLQKALKVLEGNKQAIDSFHAGMKQQQKEAAQASRTMAASSSGMVAGAAQAVAAQAISASASDEAETPEAMDVDQQRSEQPDTPSKQSSSDTELPSEEVKNIIQPPRGEPINLDEESEDELAAKQLAGEMMQNMRH